MPQVAVCVELVTQLVSSAGQSHVGVQLEDLLVLLLLVSAPFFMEAFLQTVNSPNLSAWIPSDAVTCKDEC